MHLTTNSGLHQQVIGSGWESIRAIHNPVRHQEVVIERPFRSALWDRLSTKPYSLTALSVGKLDFSFKCLLVLVEKNENAYCV